MILSDNETKVDLLNNEPIPKKGHSCSSPFVVGQCAETRTGGHKPCHDGALRQTFTKGRRHDLFHIRIKNHFLPRIINVNDRAWRRSYVGHNFPCPARSMEAIAVLPALIWHTQGGNTLLNQSAESIPSHADDPQSPCPAGRAFGNNAKHPRAHCQGFDRIFPRLIAHG